MALNSSLSIMVAQSKQNLRRATNAAPSLQSLGVREAQTSVDIHLIVTAENSAVQLLI